MIPTYRRIYLGILALPKVLIWKTRNYKYSNDEKTIDILLKEKKGLVRIGNSELAFLAGHDIKHQKFNNHLRKKIINILKTKSDAYNIALPIDLLDDGHQSIRVLNKRVWGITTRYMLRSIIRSHEYLSPFVFRIKDVTVDDIDDHISKIKKLFDHREIIYVGPNVGKNATVWESINPAYWIVIPDKNAFSAYDQIRDEIHEKAKTMNRPLVLVVAGITATALAGELSQLGVQTIDLGQMTRHIHETHR